MAAGGTSGDVRRELKREEPTAEQQQQLDWMDWLVTVKVEAAKAALVSPESSTLTRLHPASPIRPDLLAKEA